RFPYTTLFRSRPGRVWPLVPEDLRSLAELIARRRGPLGGDPRPGILERLRERANCCEDGPGACRDGQHLPAPGVISIGCHADPLVELAAFRYPLGVGRREDDPARLDVRDLLKFVEVARAEQAPHRVDLRVYALVDQRNTLHLPDDVERVLFHNPVVHFTPS